MPDSVTRADPKDEDGAPIVASDPPIGRAELLAALDWEVQQAQDECRMPGWTPYALWGAVGAVSWKLLEVLQEQPPHSGNVAAVFVAGWLGVLLYRSARDLFIPLDTIRSMARLMSSRFLSAFRMCFIAEALLAFLLLCVAKNLRPIVSWELKWLTVVWFAWVALENIAVVGLSRSELAAHLVAHATASEKMRLWTKLHSWLAVVFSLMLLVAWIGLVHHHAPSFTQGDVRAGVLAVAVTALIGVLITPHHKAPLVASLSAIRSDLALARISLDEAVRQTDTATLGMTTQQAFRDHVEPIHDGMAGMMRLLYDLESRCTTMDLGTLRASTGADAQLSQRVQRAANNAFNDYTKRRERMRQKVRALETWIDIAVLLPEIRQEVQQIKRTVETSVAAHDEEADKRIARIRETLVTRLAAEPWTLSGRHASSISDEATAKRSVVDPLVTPRSPVSTEHAGE